MGNVTAGVVSVIAGAAGAVRLATAGAAELNALLRVRINAVAPEVRVSTGSTVRVSGEPIGANTPQTLTGVPINGATRTVPLGFNADKQFLTAAQELQGALKQSGITDATIGVRGSSVTGNSLTKGTQFGPQSDIDFFIESQQLTNGYTTSKNIPGFVHPNKILPDYPLLQDWSNKWTSILRRDVTPGAFVPGKLPTQPSIVVKPFGN